MKWALYIRNQVTARQMANIGKNKIFKGQRNN
jgi:hypothetical protein